MLKAGFHKRSDAGAAMVETALVIPFLLLLLIGVYYVSVMMHAQALLTNIAQEGSRYMSRKGGLELATMSSSIEDLKINTDLVIDSAGIGNHKPAHDYIRRLLLAMNQRDSKFLIENINLESTIIRELDSVNQEHKRVEVKLRASIIPDGFLPVSMLQMIGIFPMSVTTSSRHPYMSG